MTSWRDTNKLLAKGARTERLSPTWLKKEEKNAARQLKLLQGGNPEEVTHKPTTRRGSAKSTGRLKQSKAEQRAALADQDVATWTEYDSPGRDFLSAVLQLDDYRHPADQAVPSEAGASSAETASAEGTAQAATPTDDIAQAAVPADHSWSEADFTPEAIAAYEEKMKANAPTILQRREGFALFTQLVHKKLQEKEELCLRAMMPKALKEEPEVKPESVCATKLVFPGHEPEDPVKLTRKFKAKKRPALQRSHRKPSLGTKKDNKDQDK
jgi:hypothetical protein